MKEYENMYFEEGQNCLLTIFIRLDNVLLIKLILGLEEEERGIHPETVPHARIESKNKYP